MFAVFGHILSLIRLVDEYSVEFMLAYELKLQAKLLESIKREGHRVDIAREIININPRLVDEIRINARDSKKDKDREREPRAPRDTRPKDKDSDKPRARDKDRQQERPANRWGGKRQNQEHDARDTPGRSSGPSGGSGSQQQQGSGAKKGRLCFDHNPAKDMVCSRGAQCGLQHLDTRKPEEAARWDKAFMSYTLNQTRRRNK
jgi:hypothetical protein